MLLIENAELNWQGSVPVNKMFDDPYFSLESGEAESKYVFLRHNNLPEAFLNKHSFAIGETGFGTGLNFFVTAQSWMAHRLSYPLSNGKVSNGKVSNGKVSNGKVSNGKVSNGKVPNGKAAKLIDSHLYYYSVEKYPISKTELLDIHKKWPQFYDLSTTLMSQYPGNCPGFHRLHFAEQNITLVLMVGDVCDMLGKLQSNMDAWFLDGFSPSKNPDMWSENVFNKIARLSNSGATFATFTAAGFVRRNLQSVGFTVNKSPGFGKKREMISGMLVNSTKGECTSPWYSLAKVKSNRSRYKQKAPVVIIGGGVAGLSCALSLAEKNIKSILIESGETFGVGASGNPAGIVLPRINANMDLVSQFYISCFETATYHYNELKNKFPELQWFQNGVLQFESDERLAKLGQLLLPSSLASVVDSKTASKIAGVDLDKSAVYYPQAGTINPFQLCEILAAAAGNNLQTLFSNTVHSLTKEDNTW
ncbi:MAG: tRNA (5-methylaminomethyl-2-thiouridine)(34)-methyltransferase MnmD, partial [Gammaproteobacteria bacterium]|nr:tRNA (5-methylaminomethyl-2-thiouridine)(34)-methyltransferase MnmD [Gammaproteobacteria bacterium]